MAISACRYDRRIVEHKFAVERDDAAIREQRQRIDFQQFGVVRPEGSIELSENTRDLRFGAAEIEPFEHVGNGCRRRVDVDVDQQAADRGRLCRGDLLDVHAAFGGEEDKRLACGRVMQHGGVELALNLGLFLDQQALDRVIADAHAENLPGHFLGFIRRAGELDAAGLAALAGRHLRLHHAGPDFCRRHRGFRIADAENAARHRNAGRSSEPAISRRVPRSS